MEQETHGVFGSINGMNFFIDGIPDKCEHEYVDDVFITKSGKIIHWYTFRQWASYTSKMRNDLIQQWSIDNEDPIIEETSECRKCHKIYSPPIWDI